MAKILIVDDSKTSRKILRGVLESEGHVVLGEAENGKIGLEEYKKLNPDIVTLDITMPEMDGITALIEIKKYDEKVKAIMVTAAGQKEKMLEAVKNGASEFITKPFEPEEILKVIKTIQK